MARTTIASLKAELAELGTAYHHERSDNINLRAEVAELEAQLLEISPKKNWGQVAQLLEISPKKNWGQVAEVTYYEDRLGQVWCKHRTGNNARSFKVDRIPA